MDGEKAETARRGRSFVAVLAVFLIFSNPAPLFADAVSYSYDELGRVTAATYSDGTHIAYAYDAAGNRTQVVLTTPVNHVPVAANDTVSVHQDVAATLDPRVNDSDADFDSLVITAKTDGGHGSVVINSGASVTYTPAGGYVGADSFTYTISDGRGGVAVGAVNVTVSADHAPVAFNDMLATLAGTASTLDPRTNDTDADGDALAVTAKTDGAHGSVAINSGTSVTYSPAGAYTGSDSFTYTISDGYGGTATGTVSVTVTAANHVPVAANDTVSTLAGTAVSLDPRVNDTDVDGDALTINAKTDGAHGTVVINSGTSVTYTPAVGYAGADSFTYTISDGHGGTATGSVSVTVSAANHVPVANTDTLTASLSTAVTFDPRTNDTDSDGDALTISAKTDGAHGSVAINSGTSVTYTPATGYSGSDNFTYTISDGHGGTATGTVSVTAAYANGTALYTKSTSGSFSFTIPTGVSYVDIEGWGAGGNGWGFSIPYYGIYVEDGGKGGGYFKKHISVTTGQTISGSVDASNGIGATTVTSPALSAGSGGYTFGGTMGVNTASGGDVNTSGHACCTPTSHTGGGAGNGGGDQTTDGANGTTPGGGGAFGYTTMGMGQPGTIKITARTS